MFDDGGKGERKSLIMNHSRREARNMARGTSLTPMESYQDQQQYSSLPRSIGSPSFLTFKRAPERVKRTRSHDQSESLETQLVSHIRCYACAESFRMPAVLELIRSKGMRVFIYDDIIHVQETMWDIFFLDYGAIVCWGMDRDFEERLLENMHRHEGLEVNPFEEIEFDEFTWAMGVEDRTAIIGETIYLQESHENMNYSKLAVSLALAQSVKLNKYEEDLEEMAKLSRPLTKELAQKGSISLTQRELSKRIGQLFEHRSGINLHADLVSVPDFFWDHGRYQPIYETVEKFVENKKRAENLNSKLGVLSELYMVLDSESRQKHATFLEWVVIALIAVEILFELADFILHYH